MDDRPTDPMRPARAVALLDATGNPLIVVGSSARGIARLEVAVAGRDERYEFKNERPNDEEAWGAIGLPSGETVEIELRGFDAEGRERFIGALKVAMEEKLVRQVRAPAKGVGDEKGGAPGAGDVYAGSYRVAMSPRWVDDAGSELKIVSWTHDGMGERLLLAPDDVKGWLDPDIGQLEIVHDDRELRELVLNSHFVFEKDPPTPQDPQTVRLCVLGDLSCSRTEVFTKPPRTNDLYIKVVADSFHTCAIRSAGLAACWGDDALAQGNQVSLAALALFDIDTHVNHTCAVDSLGTALCWGENDSGQLGSGSPFFPTAVPRPVSSTQSFRHVATGRQHTCAIDAAGGVWCWGANSAGQLGNGAGGTYGQISVTPVRAPLVTGGAVAIDAGDYHTCVVTTAGVVECWGLNDLGELGIQPTTRNLCLAFHGTYGSSCERSPTPVSGNGNFNNQDVVAVSAGAFQSCAVQSTGALFCWGNRWKGDGTGSSSFTAVPVDAGQTFARVSVGAGHACGVTRTGEGRCWGWNFGGELGIGAASSSEPVPKVVVSPPSAFHSIGMGRVHGCGIRSDRTALFCWGAGGSWLGYPSSAPAQPKPEQVTAF